MNESAKERGLPELRYSKSSSPTGGEIIPRLRFPKFRGTTGWRAGTIADISTVVRGGSPRPIDDFITEEADGLNWLRIGDVHQEAKYIYMTSQRVLMSALSKTRTISPGDLILSNSMSFGRPYISQIDSCIHDGWLAVTRLQTSVLNEFAYYLLLSEQSQAYFESAAAGSGVRNLNLERVAALPIAWPTVEEQRKIAECLESLDELITAEAEKLEAMKRHKQGLLQQLLPAEGETTPRLRFPQCHNTGEWQIKTLQAVATIRSGTTPARTNAAFFQDGTIPWVKTMDLNNSEIHHTSEMVTELSGVRVNPAGSVLVAMYGGFNQIGRTGMLTMPAATNQAIAVLIPDADKLSARYLLVWLNANVERWKRVAASSRKDANITSNDVANFPIAYPGVEEQVLVTSSVEAIESIASSVARKLMNLRNHKASLMQQLFPGLDEVET